jgi:hypothetical protein
MSEIPLTPYEEKAKKHAILCTTGFLVILPLGSLFARYARTFTNKWLYVHGTIQVLIAGPIIYAGWAEGYQLAGELGVPNFKVSVHQKIGLALLLLYLVQIVLGPAVHLFKMRSIFRGHRPPHNYLHVAVGLSIIALASYQVHYGLYFEWYDFVGIHLIPKSCRSAWLALTIIFWALYGLGLALLYRQFRKEREFRKTLNL